MTVRKNLSLLLTAVLLCCTACTSAAPTADTADTANTAAPAEESAETAKSLSVLFIGNSYTYYNDMPAIFRAFAEADGHSVTVTSITKGSYKLEQFADPADEYGAKVEEALSGDTKYDYVILQEQSVRPTTVSVSGFYKAVRNLTARIREAGAEPILYATWGRKTGSSTLDTYKMTNESMTWKLAAAYQAIGDELSVPVVHVGLAFYDVYTHQTDIELYNEDKSHPSAAGSYLAAASLYAHILDTDPTASAYAGSLPQSHAEILREAAQKAVSAPPAIPDAYKMNSEGVG